MSYCDHVHHAGYVSNIDLEDEAARRDKSRALMSRTTCAREVCEKAAARAVTEFTGEPAMFFPFSHSRPANYVPRVIEP